MKEWSQLNLGFEFNPSFLGGSLISVSVNGTTKIWPGLTSTEFDISVSPHGLSRLICYLFAAWSCNLFSDNSRLHFVLPIVREPRGFGFVQFVDPNDAQEAKYQMDGQILLGRQLTVVFAEENRKKPTDMRQRERR